MSQLTNIQCKNAKYSEGSNDTLVDGGGLYLLLKRSGAKIWRQRYRFNGKENTLTHGSYPSVSLLAAREKREEAKTLLLQGIDPAMAKKAAKQEAERAATNTFKLVAKEWHSLNLERWSASHGRDIWHRFEMDIFPQIGDLPIADLKPLKILEMLRLIEKRGAFETARRSMQYCGQIFRYGVITERCDRDVTAELKGVLKPFKKGH